MPDAYPTPVAEHLLVTVDVVGHPLGDRRRSPLTATPIRSPLALARQPESRHQRSVVATSGDHIDRLVVTTGWAPPENDGQIYGRGLRRHDWAWASSTARWRPPSPATNSP